jgi:ParB family transcriptional regulator, chromosome partitioning protein
MARNALGRGLSALIREPGPATAAAPALAPAEASAAAKSNGEAIQQIDIDLIEPSPYQPRTRFQEAALDELARSIKASGVIQPILVRRKGERFELIAGERRWRAAQRSALSRVPAIVREVADEAAVEMTLVENLQREDLNAIEQASAFERLIQDFHLTQEQVAERTGKDRATIANSIRLLKLEQSIQDLISEAKLSAGHGRALLAIQDAKVRLECAQRAARGGLTVRQIERLGQRPAKPNNVGGTTTIDPNTRAALEELQRKYGTRVTMRPGPNGKSGQILFDYYSSNDLTRLYEQLMNK